MNDRKNNKNQWDIGSLIVIAIAFSFFWPLGVFLILKKLGVFDFSSNKKTMTDSARRARAEKYKVMTEGREVESIEYLASAVGISYESAMRDLQQMVAEGHFGSQAYINYVDKTIVLRPPQRSSADATRSSSQNRSSSAASSGGQSNQSQKSAAQKNNSLYSIVPTFLGAIGLLLFLFGLSSLGSALKAFIADGLVSSLWDIIRGAFLIIGGGASLLVRGSMKRRMSRIASYLSFISGEDSIALADLASRTGVSMRTLRRDLEVMTEKGLLNQGAYIDIGAGVLVLNPKARKTPEKSAPVDDENRYRVILREIRQINETIPDKDVSDRIDRIEELTAKIFNEVEEKPEKLPQIKSFMSYYLPTTLKLLRSYAEFEKSGAEGENVEAAKADIERILDTLVDGFRKQLDKLYKADAIDISSDINVLETMMQRDGLTGDGSGFGQVSGGR